MSSSLMQFEGCVREFGNVCFFSGIIGLSELPFMEYGNKKHKGLSLHANEVIYEVLAK